MRHLSHQQKSQANAEPRDEIGCIVDAGGYHQVLQLATVHALKIAGLIQTERSTWPEQGRRTGTPKAPA